MIEEWSIGLSFLLAVACVPELRQPGQLAQGLLDVPVAEDEDRVRNDKQEESVHEESFSEIEPDGVGGVTGLAEYRDDGGGNCGQRGHKEEREH